MEPPALPSPSAAARQNAVPWLVLGVWLAVDLGVVIYWALHEWGFLGDLLLLIALVLHMLALVMWVMAFALLADWRWHWRLGYFLGGLAAVAGLMECIFRFPDEAGAALATAALLVGWSIPMLWLRRHGRRFALTPGGQPRRAAWQFTIGDIFVATTQAAALLALSIAPAMNLGSGGDLVIHILLLVGTPAVAIIGLAWRRFWLAVLACVALCTLLTVLPVWWLGSSPQVWEYLLVLAIVGGGAGSLLAAIGALRWAGYRLR